jgi:hypothetical protein
MADQEPEMLPAVPHDQAGRDVALSLLVPGLGQLAQGRRLAAATQFGTVLGYIVASHIGVGGGAAFFALAWNVWSAIDAYRHARE